MMNAAEKKITKAMVLNFIKENVETMNFEGAEITAEDVTVYVDTTLTQLANKNIKAAERRAEKAAENDSLKTVVEKVLTNELQSREDILAQVEGDELTVNKIGARLTALVKEGRAEKDNMKTPAGRKIVGYRLPSTPVEDAE